jgi:hypothetical protein
MTMRLTDRPKRADERNAFEIANSNRASFKDFKKNLLPEEAPTQPPMRNGRPEHPSITLARRNMDVAKQTAQADAAHSTRFQSVAQDTETVGALMLQWMRQTSGFVPTEHNKLSLTNAVNEWLLKGHALSIAALNDIFNVLVEGNYLQRSGHARVRGEGGIMTGRATIYPVYETASERQQESLQSAPTVVGDRELSLSELRKMSDQELAARARAGYKPNPNNIRVI